MLAVKCQWAGFGTPEGMFSDREIAFGIHGGDRETSLMLHFRPETVDMGKAIDFASSAETSALPPIGPLSYGWVASDLNPDGTVGEAHLASAEKGKATAEYQVARFIAMLRDLRDRPLDGLSATKDGPA